MITRPPYQKRPVAELRKALKWAKDLLGLENWGVTILSVAAWEREHPDLEIGGSTACIAYDISLDRADVVISKANCVEDQVDPLYSLFHELYHLEIWFCDAIDPEGRWHKLWEKQCNTVASILCDLYRERK